jgi:hypothetical protein
MDGTCWTGEIHDQIDFGEIGLDDIMTHELELRMVDQMSNVVLVPGMKVIETDDLPSHAKISIAEMATEKACSTSDQDTFSSGSSHLIPPLFRMQDRAIVC